MLIIVWNKITGESTEGAIDHMQHALAIAHDRAGTPGSFVYNYVNVYQCIVMQINRNAIKLCIFIA